MRKPVEFFDLLNSLYPRRKFKRETYKKFEEGKGRVI